MLGMKTFGTAVVAASMVMALTGASTASAANWDPPGTVVHGHGTLTLTSGTFTLTCTTDLNVRATGALAQTTNAAGTLAGPTFGCTNSLGTATVMTSSASWTATATSTTSVDVITENALINIGSGACTITWDNVSVGGNTWSNPTHTLTSNSSVAFPITRTGFCFGTAATMSISGSVAIPLATIT